MYRTVMQGATLCGQAGRLARALGAPSGSPGCTVSSATGTSLKRQVKVQVRPGMPGGSATGGARQPRRGCPAVSQAGAAGG